MKSRNLESNVELKSFQMQKNKEDQRPETNPLPDRIDGNFEHIPSNRKNINESHDVEWITYDDGDKKTTTTTKKGK